MNRLNGGRVRCARRAEDINMDGENMREATEAHGEALRAWGARRGAGAEIDGNTTSKNSLSNTRVPAASSGFIATLHHSARLN